MSEIIISADQSSKAERYVPVYIIMIILSSAMNAMCVWHDFLPTYQTLSTRTTVINYCDYIRIGRSLLLDCEHSKIICANTYRFLFHSMGFSEFHKSIWPLSKNGKKITNVHGFWFLSERERELLVIYLNFLGSIKKDLQRDLPI